jgi:hypothetical protein
MKKQSSSYLPNGGYTLTNGSNYMLDGFQYDTEYNGGVLEKARLPEAKGLSSLPSGILPNDTPRSSVLPSHVDEEGGIHLGDFLKESSFQYVPIVDHSWLAQETQANLEGVRNKKDVYEQMENSFYEDSALKELSEMWDESTNGLGLVPNKNREFVKVVNKYDKPQAQQPGDEYREKIEKAMRRSAYGEPLKVILADLKTDLGNRYTDDIGNRIASDHGLHGKVYIREEAFKGLFNGKWDKQIKARCASAKYIIPASKDCVFDYHQGRKVVSNINWKSAFEHYAPKLKTVGIKLGSGTNYQARLKQAFLSQAPAPVQPQTWFAYQEDLTKKYSSEQASEKFANYIPEVVDVGTTRDREINHLNNKFAGLLENFKKSNFLSESQYEEITSLRSLEQKTAKLNEYLLEQKQAQDYEGGGVGKKGMHSKVIQEIDPHYTTPAEREKQAQENKFTLLATQLVKLGMATKNQVEQIAGMQGDYHTKTQYLKKLASKPVMTKAGNYLGSGVNVKTMEGKSYSNDFGNFDNAEQRYLALRSRVAKDKVSRMIKAGLITLNQMEKIACGCSNPEEVIQGALDFITQSQSDVSNKAYSETKYEQLNLLKEAKNDFVAFQKELSARLKKDYQAMKDASVNISDKEYDNQQWSEQSKLKQANNNFKSIQQELELRLKKASEMPLLQKEKEVMAVNRKIEATLNSIVTSGLLDRSKLENLVNGISNPQKKLAKVLNHLAGASQKKDYTDTQYTQHIETKKASVKLASKDTVETWLRQKMAEGAVGNDLDVMLKARFASEVLDHYADSIKAIRTAHEGLSGQVYVDAGAYEKVGCEQGALQHRSNMIPAVLQMDKCATCVFKNAEGTCQKYNKPVIASLSQMGIDNPKKYQKESIRLANASDSEKTASLFVNNYDEDEFNLTTNEEIEIETDTSKTPDGLKDVLFGGFEF